jgi:hypothetical protein
VGQVPQQFLQEPTLAPVLACLAQSLEQASNDDEAPFAEQGQGITVVADLIQVT